MEVITNSIRVAKLSLDYYHFSPVLRSQLRDKRGDLVVSPVSEAEVLRVAQVCVKYQVPLTVREVPSSTDGSGAGTGNYGQCVPLEGGVILDKTRMNAIRWIWPGVACVEPRVKMAAFDKQAREMIGSCGWFPRLTALQRLAALLVGAVAGLVRFGMDNCAITATFMQLEW